MVSWVEAWRTRPGTISRARAARPGSCTSTASTPDSYSQTRYSRTSGSSRSCTSVLTVTYTFTPRAWAYAIVSAISSPEKFCANFLAPNRFPLR
ncbi:MAG: hypothetical protein WAL62_08070 [Methanoregula sp.]